MPLEKLIPKPQAERERITIAVSAEMRDRINKVATMMGFTQSEAVRYLMARGLEGLTAVTATSESASALKSMMELFEAADQREQRERKSRSVPSNTRTTVQKSTGATLFDVHAGGEKKRKK